MISVFSQGHQELFTLWLMWTAVLGIAHCTDCRTIPGDPGHLLAYSCFSPFFFNTCFSSSYEINAENISENCITQNLPAIPPPLATVALKWLPAASFCHLTSALHHYGNNIFLTLLKFCTHYLYRLPNCLNYKYIILTNLQVKFKYSFCSKI
jgi:hypothetical protein